MEKSLNNEVGNGYLENEPPRRSFLQGASRLIGVVGASMLAPLSQSVQSVERSKPASAIAPPAQTVSTPASLVVETTSGQVRGFISTGIQTFKGIPYGAASQRFMPARRPVPWTGVRNCLSYGPTCPQPVSNSSAPPNDLASFYAQGEPGRPGEDCLRINVWTPGIAVSDNTSGKRPVMIWIHGGGFESGSSHESLAYHGESLSRRGDVVFVSLNHRLNVLGFLNLAPYDPSLVSSANVGLLDIVLALEWVRDNITRFGGDPGNVTLIGQSGGGRKVSTLLAMPAAQGLFHKAIIHSGSLLTVGLPEETAAIAAATLAELGLSTPQLSSAQIEQLQTVPVMRLIEAYKAAQQKLVTPTSTVFDPPYCTPTLDGIVIPVQPFDTTAPAISAQIPMLIGSTLNEVSPSRYVPALEEMTEAELKAMVALDYGDRTEEIIAVFKRAHPKVKPIDIFSLIQSLPPRRSAAVRQIEIKAQQAAAAVYNFQFAWHTPMLDGRPRAHHGSDLPFAFNNVDRCLNATGGEPEARTLAARMSDAWVSFARTGNPNHAGLPHWPAVTPGRLPTMIFNASCEVQNDHDREERRLATVIPESLRHL